jgi:acyl-CoA hydrolase
VSAPAALHSVRQLTRADEILDFVADGTDLAVSQANGEPVELIDALEAAAGDGERDGLTVHQMHPLGERPSITGALGRRMTHTSYFLSGANRRHVGAGVNFVPANFSEVPQIIRQRSGRLLVLATVAERDGVLYWGTNGEYVAALVRDGVEAVVEANDRMPVAGAPLPAHRVLAALPVSRPLAQVPAAMGTPVDARIAELVAERIGDGSTLQIGIGAIPDMVLAQLGDRNALRVHTELLTDGVVTLDEAGALAASAADPAVATFTLGTDRLYDWMDGNPRVAIRPVDEVNRPAIIAAQPRMVSICATTEVDLYGQCASATVAGRWYSGSGGQLDFMRGVHMSSDGRGFVVLRSTLKDGSSRIKAALAPGSAVTTGIHFVDMVVTEHGVAELAGRSLSERARALIAIAAPEHRDELTLAARAQGLL